MRRLGCRLEVCIVCFILLFKNDLVIYIVLCIKIIDGKYNGIK